MPVPQPITVVLTAGPEDGREKQEVGCEVGLEESMKALGKRGDSKAVGRLMACLRSVATWRLETPVF